MSWAQRYTTPYVQEWNFTVQKQLPWDMVWETSYVGNIGIHLWGQTEGNQPLANGPGAVVTRRPLAQYTVAPIKSFAPWNRSTYEGLSSRLEKRFSRGVSFLASFTHGRALDLQNAALDACDGCGAGDTVQSAYNRDAQKGPSDNNVPLRFAFGGIWDLPFGPGRALFRQGWSSKVFGLWQISAVYQVQSGLPFTARLSFDNANAGTISYPNRVCAVRWSTQAFRNGSIQAASSRRLPISSATKAAMSSPDPAGTIWTSVYTGASVCRSARLPYWNSALRHTISSTTRSSDFLATRSETPEWA